MLTFLVAVPPAVLRQDGATHPGTFVGPMLPGSGGVGP